MTLDDPMLLAELIAAKRDQQDVEWRARNAPPDNREWLEEQQRRSWHTAYHGGPFEACPAPVCSGEVLG